MFNKEDTIHFGCTQCGKCCDKPPMANFYDLFNLADEFVFQTAHHGFISYNKENEKDDEISRKLNEEKDAIKQFYRMIGHTIVLPEIDAVLFYYINFMAIEYPQSSCSKLKDNLCSIYSKRPSSCKLSPINDGFDDTQQWRTINLFKEKVETQDWKCDFSEKSPILYKNEEIYSLNHNSLYFHSIGANRDITDKYINFIKNGGDKYFQNHFKAVLNTTLSKSQMITDLIIPLTVGLKEHVLDESTVIDFVEKQIILIEKELSKSSFFKIKDNLKVSRLYKKQRDDYKNALKNNLFKLDQSDFGII